MRRVVEWKLGAKGGSGNFRDGCSRYFRVDPCVDPPFLPIGEFAVIDEIDRQSIVPDYCGYRSRCGNNRQRFG